MLTKRTTLKQTFIASGLFLIALCCVSLLINEFASRLTENSHHLAQFRLQLSVMVVSITGIFSISFLAYKHYYSSPAITDQTTRLNTTIQTEEKALSTAPNILVVDDNTANILVIKEFLKSSNLNIYSSNNGKKAIDIYKAHPLDMIFMDIEMDDWDGFKTTEVIRSLQTQQRIPIVAVSAHSESDKRLEALLRGFDDYIVKPVNEKHLSNALQRWLNHNNDDKTKKDKLLLIPSPSSPINIPQTALKTPRNQQENSIDKVVNIEKSLEYSNQNKLLAKDMLNLLVVMIKKESANIHYLYQKKEWQELYHLVHKLYGGSCYCGVAHLQEASQRVENILQQHTYDSVDEPIQDLFDAMDDIIQWDNEYDADIIFGIDP